MALKNQISYGILVAFSSESSEFKTSEYVSERTRWEISSHLWIKKGLSEKLEHMTGIVVKSVLPAYYKVLNRRGDAY